MNSVSDSPTTPMDVSTPGSSVHESASPTGSNPNSTKLNRNKSGSTEKASGKRGRKQDDSLPPSKAREIQRAFRQRRAEQLTTLENRVKQLEQENEQLKRELAQYRSGVAPAYSHASMSTSRTLETHPMASPSTSASKNTFTKELKVNQPMSATYINAGRMPVKQEDFDSSASLALPSPSPSSAASPSSNLPSAHYPQQHQALPPMQLPSVSDWHSPSIPSSSTSPPPPLGYYGPLPPMNPGQSWQAFSPAASLPISQSFSSTPVPAQPRSPDAAAASVLTQWSHQQRQPSPPSSELTSPQSCGPSSASKCCPPPSATVTRRKDSLGTSPTTVIQHPEDEKTVEALARASKPLDSETGQRKDGNSATGVKERVFDPNLCCGGLIDCSEPIYEEDRNRTEGVAGEMRS